MGGLDEVEEYVLLRPERVTSEVLPACLHAECTRAEPFISTIECRWKSRLVMPSCGSFQSIQARPWRGHFGSPRRGRLRCRRSVGSLSEICRRSGGSPSEICRKSVGSLSEVCRSVGSLSEVCRKSVGNLSEISDGVSNAIKTDAPTVGNLSETFRHTLTVGNLAEPVGNFRAHSEAPIALCLLDRSIARIVKLAVQRAWFAQWGKPRTPRVRLSLVMYCM